MLNTGRTLVSLLRELRLSEIQKSAERPVRLAVLGHADMASELAGKLGQAPWVSVLLSLEEQRPGDVLLRVSRGEAPGEPLPAGALELVLGGEALEKELPERLGLPSLDEASLRDELAPALLRRAPEDLRLSLARHLPVLRPAYGAQLIEQTSRSNAFYAASAGVAKLVPVLNVPLNVADTLVLTKNQLMMAYKLALAEGKEGQPQELMKEILSVVGGGFLFRQLARGLVGLVPGWGIAPKVVIAYAGTWVIGRTVQVWARHGEAAALEEMKRSYDEALVRGRKLAKSLAQRLRPGGRHAARPRARGPKGSLPPHEAPEASADLGET